MAKKSPIGDELRQALLDCGKSRYQVALDLGIAEGHLSRFVNGEGGLAMKTADRLAEYLGWRLQPESPRKKGRK